jgi:hypothetical protein
MLKQTKTTDNFAPFIRNFSRTLEIAANREGIVMARITDSPPPPASLVAAKWEHQRLNRRIAPRALSPFRTLVTQFPGSSKSSIGRHLKALQAGKKDGRCEKRVGRPSKLTYEEDRAISTYTASMHRGGYPADKQATHAAIDSFLAKRTPPKKPSRTAGLVASGKIAPGY